MKNLLLILSVLALAGTLTAATPSKQACCKGKECCSMGCCKK